MKLSLCVDSPEDSSGEGDCTIFDFSGIEKILEGELEKFYPDSTKFENVEISISFVKPDYIRELNRNYRNVDEATDVLSFPMIEDEAVEIPELPVLSLGDIIICPEEVKRLHSEMNFDEAICLMIAHSFLHLLCFDHYTEEKQIAMWKSQDEIKEKLMTCCRRNK